MPSRPRCSKPGGAAPPPLVMSALRTGLLLLLCLPVHAEIYKWTDESGRLHFGDKPTGKKVEMLEAPAAPAAVATPSASAPDAAAIRERQRRLLEVMQAERDARERALREEQAEKAKNERQCRRVATTLKNAEGRVLYQTSDAGEDRQLTPEQTQQYLDGLRGALKEHCQ